MVENTGGLDLTGVTLVDDLDDQFSDAFVGVSNLTVQVPPPATSSVMLNGTFNGDAQTGLVNPLGTSLSVGDSFTLRYTVEIDFTEASNVLTNTVGAVGTPVDELGNSFVDSAGMTITVTDDSDSGADPGGTNPGEDGDMGTSDDPTPVLLPLVGLAKSAGTCLLYTSPSPRDRG